MDDIRKKICILVPCYNEYDNILQMKLALDDIEFDYLFVNDGSTDKTLELSIRWGIPICSYYPNKGKGYAIKYGAEQLNQILEKDYVLIMDADGQHSITDIRQFLHTLEEYPKVKIIIGNRLINPTGMPLIRYIANKITSWIISWKVKTKIEDSQCGYRLIHKDIFDIPTKSNNFEYESEILIKAGRLGYQIKNIPIKCIYNKNRESKIDPLKDTIKFIKMIMKF